MHSKRLLTLCGVLLLFMMIVLCRVYWISTDSGYADRAVSQTEYSVSLPTNRGNFYDRNGKKLTGVRKVWYTLCIPGDDSYASLFPYVDETNQTKLYELRNTAAPFLLSLGKNLSQVGITCYEREIRYLNCPIAEHLLGYVDGENRGVTGLELAYDDILTDSGSEELLACTTTANGRLLSKAQPTTTETAKGSGLGVQLTLDADIQRLCEGVAQSCMERGCILVLDAQTSEVLASVSMPEYDPENVAKSIAANDTSLLNRTTNSFASGSVFKIVLAVAAYNSGLDWYTWECEGSVQVGNQIYRCAQGKQHGELNLRGALEQSCNCYFIELGQLLGAETILNTAKELGFGSPCLIAPGMKSTSGVLPELSELESAGQLAMLSFGQGNLSVTPIQIAQMTAAVANGGQMRSAKFVKGIIDEETLQPAESGEQQEETQEAVQVCEPRTAEILQSMLVSVVEEGIGGKAAPQTGGAGGKTGTAQTGQYNGEGEELLNLWFTGFYPAEQPRFVITVLQDGVTETEFSSAEIFAKVADGLAVYTG